MTIHRYRYSAINQKCVYVYISWQEEFSPAYARFHHLIESTSAQHPNLFAIIKFESIVHRFAERLISNSFSDDIFVLFVFA